MRAVGAVLGLAASLALALGGSASATTHEVGANGNPFTGGLSFTPADVSGAIGDVVRWTNTDPLVPHTATEDHGLWDLSGSYGGTPVNPPGFGPGEARERAFEAGTFNYFCEVHPVDMRGVVRVAPTVKRAKRGKKRLRVTWAPSSPAEGQVFDVKRRKGGEWRLVRDGTTASKGRFGGKGSTFRARLRLAADPTAASDWSPAAKPGGSSPSGGDGSGAPPSGGPY
ncbi:MAG: cupredoxin domain-containing protein [Solirubrobacterales bacterium]